jgi:hypothetical protein
MTTPDYILRGNGLYLPRGYEIEPPRQPRMIEFFAYERVGGPVPCEPFWRLAPEVYERHNVVAYLDQYENALKDHVEELLIRFPHIDAHFDYQSELTWKAETEERRITYYDKLGL